MKQLSILFILLISIGIQIPTSSVFSKPAPQISIKSGEDVFHKWISGQTLRNDISIYDHLKDIRPDHIDEIIDALPQEIHPQLVNIIPEIQNLPLSNPKDHASLTERLLSIYNNLENNMPAFIALLEENQFSNQEILDKEDSSSHSNVLAKYRKTMEALLNYTNTIQSESLMGSLANRMFEFCYYPETFPHYYRLIENPEKHAIVKLLNEITWYYLARLEWKSWHKSTLENLKREYDRGKKIVYIAGGSDIYQLLNHGIYDIVNIDPIYPTQDRYYSEGWEFLAKGNIGDIIILSDDLRMKRTSYSEKGYVIKNEMIYGKKISIPNSITVWNIIDREENKIGEYRLLRRFVNQNDFKISRNQALLISFNELYFILNTTPENWGINPKKFSKDFTIHIKQLRAPLNHDVIMNIRKIQESAYPHVFGSSVIGR